MLSWKVYREDFNAKKIEKYDIFKRGISGGENYFEKIAKELKEKYPDKDQWAEEFRLELMYRFWCKAEHEIILTSWPPYVTPEEIERMRNELKRHQEQWGYAPYHTDVRLTVGEKIDIYDQLRLNWEVFINYVWENI